MRLLLTTDTVGGVWTFNLHLAAELLRLGNEVALVSFGWGLSSWQQQQVDGLRFRFPSHCSFHTGDAALEWMPENRTAYRDGEALLLQLCERLTPEVLVSSQFCWGALPVRMPKIVLAHSDVLSWAEAVGKAPLPEHAWLAAYRAQVQAGLDGATWVTAPTAAMVRDLCRTFQVGAPTSVIANGLTLPQQPEATRTLQAVTAGRMWDEAKNLAVLYGVRSPMPIVVAGEQGAGMQALPPATRVLPVGALPHAALLQLFAQSAMYLCTSCYEPFGLAALEAALCGCAVLANDIPSLREVWGDAALYFQDAEGLSRQLQQLSGDAGLLADAQRRSRERAAQYTAAAMATQYLQLAQHLTQRAQGSAVAGQAGDGVLAS